MKRNFKVLFCSIFILTLASCVSTKKFNASQASLKEANENYLKTKGLLFECETKNKNQIKSTSNSEELVRYQNQITDLKSQLDFVKQNNTTALSRLQDLSVITESQANSIKKSLDNLGMKDLYINDLRRSIAFKDSLNKALIFNIKSALDDINDKDINVKIEKDVVYIDIADKKLFESGSYNVTNRAKIILGKVAKVLNAHPDLEFLVEGNTDNKPYKNGVLLDNWDLSTKRASSVARILQYNYKLDPKHITVAGRGEFLPVDTNSTAEGRASNRRTRIIILPQLDQFFKLLIKK